MLDVLALVADAVAVIRLGNADGAKVCRDLTDEHLVDARNDDVRLRGALDLDALGLSDFDGMGEPDVEDELVAALQPTPLTSRAF